MTDFINPRLKLLQHIDRLASLKAGYYTAPVNVEIDLSNRCSLGCQWCHFAYTHTRGPLAGQRDKPENFRLGGDLMNYDLALNIISDLTSNGIRSLTWTGGGEPTLHPQFNDIIRFASHRPIDQGLYTHGGHIDVERAAILKDRLQWVYVSLDCADRETYKAEKGVDRFEAACAGVRHLAEARGNATVGVGFLIHAGNYKRAKDMLNLALRLGADYAQFRPAVMFGIHAPGQPSENTEWIDDALEELTQVTRSDRAIVDVNRFMMYRFWRGHGYGVCYWSGLQTVITPDGSLWTCVNKREHAGAWLGNLNEEPFYDIWSKHGGAHQVDSACRVMCRGHVPNMALQEIMLDMPHKNFI